MESNSIPYIYFINAIHDFFSTFSCFCSHPLFYTFVTIYTLILLYAPSFFLRVVLSPVLNSAGIILLFLLKLGANERLGKDLTSQDTRILGSSENERLEKESRHSVFDHKDKNLTNIELGFQSNQTDLESKPNSSLVLESNQMIVGLDHDFGPEFNDECYKGELLDTISMKSSQVVEKGETRMIMDSIQVDTTMEFLEWNMKAPLEIIYEAYEGEEEEDDDGNENNMDFSDKYVMGCERYPSLSMYYPESETDSSSDDDFQIHEKRATHGSLFLKWEIEEDEREELIEISLDHYGKRSIELSQDEEDSLIEIDIFPQETE